MRKQAFRRAPLLVLSLTAMALAGCSFGGPEEAGDIAGRQAPNGPPSVTAATILDIADRTRASGDTVSAISFYRRAHAMSPGDPRPLVGLGEMLNQVGSPNEAIEVFREAVQLAPSDTDALRGLGVTLVALNQPAEAIDQFKKAIAHTPDARAFGGLGVAEDLIGDYAAAEAAYRRGLALAPNDLTLRNNLGLSLALLGKYDAAIEMLRAVAVDAGANARHRLNLALVLGLAGKDDEAAQVARIDLDERAVRSNLAYYTELRHLSPSTRAQAILRPNEKLPPSGASNGCMKPPCGGKDAETGSISAVPPAAASSGNPIVAVGSEPLPQTAAPPDPSSLGVDRRAPPVSEAGRAIEKLDSNRAAAAESNGISAAAGAKNMVPSLFDAETRQGDSTPDQLGATPEPLLTAPEKPAASVNASKEKRGAKGRWVQVGTARRRRQAEHVWRAIASRNGDLVDNLDHFVEPVDLGSKKGTYFRVRVGPLDTINDARDLCSAFRSRKVGCFVVPAPS